VGQTADLPVHPLGHQHPHGDRLYLRRLPGRSFWLTAIMAPRFLGSAFASGPALLILLCFILRKFSRFDAGKESIQALAKIVTYALIASVFFVLMESSLSSTARSPSICSISSISSWVFRGTMPWSLGCGRR